jgi:aerobic-type carbon monoxide dehydrogenase small subunit (CoxS/CutS family)
MNADIEIDQTAKVKVQFRLNGIELKKAVPASWTLLRFLRDGLGYTGTKCGCEIGECGACTVLYDRRAVSSCLILAGQIDGADIWTIEGVAGDGGAELHPVQQAFVDCDAVHCGFCTPGMIISTIALLLENKNPNEDDIKTALAGNLCRCTGYIQIIEAVKKAASQIKDKDMNKFKNSAGKNAK